MQIGQDCFLDEHIRSMIASENRLGNCEIQKTESCLVYDTEQDSYLEEYIEEILDVFTVAEYLKVSETDSRVDYLNNYLVRWKLFSVNAEEIKLILKFICAERFENEPDLFDKKVTIREFFSQDDMNRYSILMNNTWDSFCYNIKHVNRFHSQQVNFTQLKKLLDNMVVDISKNTLRLFRARICDEKNYVNGFSATEMGPPPVPYVTPGRTNSEGIQCLYLSSNRETTFHEVRARHNDHVSVGEFIQRKDLRIIDLSFLDRIGPFSVPDFDMTWFAINIEIIRKIADEVSKPMRRFDSALDYIPTQYICDYIKHLGYDGIKFKSTLKSGGINYAIFDEKKFKCENVINIQIDNMTYECVEL